MSRGILSRPPIPRMRRGGSAVPLFAAVLWVLAAGSAPVLADPPQAGWDSLVRSRLHLAGELTREHRWEEALALYREIAESHPGQPKAVRGMKTCLLELKRYEELRGILEEEARTSPDHPAILEELGTVAARMGDRESAVRWWRRILDVQGGSRGAYAMVADLMTRNRMLDEALAVYAEADSLHPGRFTRQKAALHELRFDFGAATREYLRFLESSPTALSYVEGRLLRIGESEEGLGAVIARVERWIEERSAPGAGGRGGQRGKGDSRSARLSGRSGDVVFRKLLGDLYLESGHHDLARGEYFRLLAEAPNQFGSLLVFGKRCQTDGEHDVAIRVFERVVTDFPTVRAVPGALTEIARSQAELGRWDDAIATYARLIDEYPETDYALAARYETGRILRIGKRDPDAAEAIFRELIRRGNGPWAEADPQFEVAECAVWRGDLETARGIYGAIRERRYSDDTRERSLFEEARALFFRHRFAEADSLFKEVAGRFPTGLHVNDALQFSILINTNPDGEAVLGMYATALMHLRTLAPEAAIESLDELPRKHPGAAILDEALLLLGRAYREAGEPDRALEVLERAVAEAQVMDLAASARLLRAEILAREKGDPQAALAEYERLLVTYPETLAADRARDLSADLTRTLP